MRACADPVQSVDQWTVPNDMSWFRIEITRSIWRHSQKRIAFPTPR
jgi:hypothetical protein